MGRNYRVTALIFTTSPLAIVDICDFFLLGLTPIYYDLSRSVNGDMADLHL